MSKTKRSRDENSTLVKKQKVDSEVDFLSINTIRCLAADMVQKANSGHPGYDNFPFFII